MALKLLSIFAILAFFDLHETQRLIAQGSIHPYENRESFQLSETLETQSSALFQNVSLRSIAHNLSDLHHVSIWIDRRVDGEQLISLEAARDRTLEMALKEIVKASHCEMGFIDQIVYIAPEGEVSKAEFSYWFLFCNGPVADSQNQAIWQWDQPTEPAKLFLARSHQTHLNLNGISLIEHDLWPAGKLPMTNLAAQWTTVLSGFGMSAAFHDPAELEIQPAPAVATVAYDYSNKQLEAIGKGAFQAWKTEWASSSTKKIRPDGWRILAPVAGHRELINLVHKNSHTGKGSSPSNSKNPPRGEKNKSSLENSQFTLTLQGDLQGVFEALDKQLGLKIDPWPLPKEIGARRISIELKQVRLDELLNKIGKEADLTITRTGTNIQVREIKK